MLSEMDLRYLRGIAVQAHSRWKNEILLCDQVEAGLWSVLWPDGTVESADPLVENIYAEALEDKTISAGAVLPMLLTPPTRGTRKDQGEKNSAKRKRVGLSYWDRSNVRKNGRKYYRDWLHTGMMTGCPWATGFSGRVRLPPDKRFAYFEQVDPRSVYPLGFDSRGNLTAALIMRQKRIADLMADWGEMHPALLSARIRHAQRASQLAFLEEIWYVDSTQWGVAIGDSLLPATHQGVMFTVGNPGAQGSMIVDWLFSPALHGLGQCPVKAQARTTVNDSPHGALLDIIPRLKIAQNFMARLLDDLQANIYAPVVLDNIKNPHEYGLGAVLVGTGQGKAFIDRDRPPVNFEAQQTVEGIIDSARREAFEPAQRSGEAGASIVSAKGTVALMGTFNAELAAAQGDMETLLAELTSATAAFDEAYCAGLKQVYVVDQTGKMDDETYDPAVLFKGDHRFRVSYGDRTGLDENQYLTRIAMIRQLEGMSRRKFMEKAGISGDVLDEETEMQIEKMVAAFYDVLIPQQLQTGNNGPMLAAWKKIDGDKTTAREAAFEALSETVINPTEGGPSDPMSPGGRAEILRTMRSLSAGGIPGRAEGQPPSQLPPEIRRMAGQIGPGGTST